MPTTNNFGKLSISPYSGMLNPAKKNTAPKLNIAGDSGPIMGPFQSSNKLSIAGDSGPIMGPFRPSNSPTTTNPQTGNAPGGALGQGSVSTQFANSAGGSTGTSFLAAITGITNNINSAFNRAFTGVPNAPGTKLGFLLRRMGNSTDTVLTSGRGVTDNAPVRQRKAGGRLKRV